MGTDGIAPPLSAKHKESFAYVTINKRLPVTLAQIADGLCRKKLTIAEQYGEEASGDMKLIISHVSKLRYEVQTNKPLVALQSSAPDLAAWNDELMQQTTTSGAPPTWYSATWLYVECYMYRALQDYVALTKVMKDYDLFGDQKRQAFTDAFQPVSSLLLYLTQVTGRLQAGDSSGDLSDLFSQFMQIALWGNRCDLSISQGAENSQKECVLQQLSALKPHILADDTSQAFAALRSAGPGGHVDIVLDNAGFELITDLCLAEFLVASGLVDSVHLHGKAMPWFVSDVTQQDLSWTLDTMTSSEVGHVSQMGAQWKSRLQDGSWKFSAHQFWTLPYSYCLMKEHAPDLHSNLASSSLVIFKGDLNYRKLVGDRAWPPTTPFSLALQGFEPAPLCALRALKADTVAGLRPGLAEEVAKQDDKWMVNGQWAVVSFCGAVSS